MAPSTHSTPFARPREMCSLGRGRPHISDVHFHNAYEIVLDRPIPKSFEGELRLPNHVHCFDDHDVSDEFVGIGGNSSTAS